MRCIAFFLLQFLMYINATAQEVTTGAPSYASSGVQGQLIEEVVHPFSVHSYSKSWEIFKCTSLDRSSPELVLSYYFTAMRLGDYAAAISVFDEVSKRDVIKRNAARGQSEMELQESWKKSYSMRRLFVKERIHYGENYVLIPYYEDRGGKFDLVQTLAFVRFDSKWWLTVELASNPLLQHWMTPGVRQRGVSKAWIQR